ncbi:MAG: DUF4232 domain-containing protein [Chloroflexota bacterium]
MSRFMPFVLALALVVGPFIAAPQTVRAQQCRFVLGFAVLHSVIPNIVGECLENEHHNPVNGDALQRTTNGLLVWRKADNFTAFTDGYRTWILGPFGLQQRLNSQRFFWEPNPNRLPIVPPPRPGDRCHTAGLSLHLVDIDPGAGNVVGTFRFVNETAVSCTFFGYVGAQLLDAHNNPLPTNVVRGGGFFSDDPGPRRFAVPAGGSAIFRLHWGQVPVGDETECPTASQLAVIPPDEFAPLIILVTIRACNGGRLNASTVQPLR